MSIGIISACLNIFSKNSLLKKKKKKKRTVSFTCLIMPKIPLIRQNSSLLKGNEFKNANAEWGKTLVTLIHVNV